MDSRRRLECPGLYITCGMVRQCDAESIPWHKRRTAMSQHAYNSQWSSQAVGEPAEEFCEREKKLIL
jgi:hypothetical protein